MYPNQKEFITEKDCENAIKNARSIKMLNQLRRACIEFNLIKLWGKRYWAFKKCPNCAKTKYGLN